MQAFEHGFTDAKKEMMEINGYLRCMQSLLRHLEEVTGFKKENRYIDSVELLDRITETNNQLHKLTHIAVGKHYYKRYKK